VKPVPVSVEAARRIAVRSQLLDGSARGVLETVRQLGFLQIDPISTVAPPQHLVLWSRLGDRYDRAELDRLLWQEKKLVEWAAHIWPIEDLPLIRARMRRRRGKYSWERRGTEFLKANAAFRRYVLRELERRGPLLSREIEDHASMRREDHDWWGSRKMGLMLDLLASRGEVAIVGRRTGQRLWDLAERWYPPETEKVSLAEAEKRLAEKRFRALGVRMENGGWVAHPDAVDGPVPDRVTFLSPFDRLIHDRDRAEALFGFRYRLEMYVPKAKREYGYYVLPILRGDRLVGRIEPELDRRRSVLRVKGVWAEQGETLDVEGALTSLGRFVGAERIGGQFHFKPERYLDMIRRELPAYEELQERVAGATDGVEARHVLDLGIGTGETARRVLELHPGATLVGVDSSPEMLAAARQAVGGDLRVARLEDELPEGPFDLVVSALAVHHLDGAGKRDLFERLGTVLRPGGRFVLGDVVVPERPEDAVSPLTPAFDLPDSVPDLLRWLEEAGFRVAVEWAWKDLVVVRADYGAGGGPE
jgi:uncharacterized protein YcaQ/SAM-dependent methyltransferase